MIQILTYEGNDKKYQGNGIKINSFHDAESLDCYDVNIIILNNKKIWVNNNDSKSNINSKEDLKSLYQMIKNCRKAQNVIIFPQNMTFLYYYGFVDFRNNRKDYQKSCELKNMISEMTQNILSILHLSISGLDLVYENTKTKVESRQITASFYFNNIDGTQCLTKSLGSEKATTIKRDGIIFSTLELDNAEEIVLFLKDVHILKDTVQECPEWMGELQMFDDYKQIDIIRENRKKIQVAESNIEQAEKVLDENNRYKSILYTSGDDLVSVVLDILEKMLGCDFSEFEDMKKEDFRTQIENDIFIGEIKGVNHNVKSENVSQLDVHYQGYMEDNPDIPSENIHALLIMDHQKNKKLQDREPVHEQQIKLAQRNGSLIIETFTLLQMFEKYLNGDMTREQCIDLLAKKTGLLEIKNKQS